MQGNRNPHHQQGVALIIGLVLLIAITIMTLAATRGARGGLLAAAQVQRLRQMENAAASGLELRFAQAQTFETTWTNDFAFPDVTFGTSNEILLETTGRHIGISAPPAGFSLTGQLAAYHFEIESRASSNPGWTHDDPMKGSRAMHTQGFYVVGPGN